LYVLYIAEFDHQVVLAVATLMAGLLADDIVNLIEIMEDQLGLSQAFLGITLLAIVPAITELVNAIKFAIHNQISLSLEIGSAGAIQAALIQVPLLVVLGATLNPDEHKPFNLIFSLFSVFSAMISVITFNYIAQDGKTNYFVGTSLLVIYLTLVAAFYFVESNQKASPKSFYIQEIPVLIKEL
jgi:Ca2+:H+ antiporter